MMGMVEMVEGRKNDVLVFSLTGRLDAASTPSFRNHLQERIAQGERWFAVDAAGLTYISSAGLSLLLHVAKQLEKRSGRIVLCALREPVRRVLGIAGFMSLFRILSSSEEAIQDCQRD